LINLASVQPLSPIWSTQGKSFPGSLIWCRRLIFWALALVAPTKSLFISYNSHRASTID